jgi:hypothetical protein
MRRDRFMRANHAKLSYIALREMHAEAWIVNSSLDRRGAEPCAYHRPHDSLKTADLSVRAAPPHFRTIASNKTPNAKSALVLRCSIGQTERAFQASSPKTPSRPLWSAFLLADQHRCHTLSGAKT